MRKRILSLLLAGLMTTGLLAGCGDNSDANNSTSVSSEVKEEEAKESDVDNSASTVVEEEKEVVDLRLLCFGTMSEHMEDFFENEFHDKILEELKIDMTVEFLPWGSQGEITTMLAGGESFAFMNIPTQFPSFVNDDYIIDIDAEQVKEIAPNYIASRYGMGFECVKIGNKYWALPIGSKVVAGDGCNITVRNDILEEVGTSYDKLTSYESLMDALAKVHEKYPDMSIWPAVSMTAKMLPAVVSPEGMYYNFSGTERVVFDQLSGEPLKLFGSEVFEKLCKLNEDFYKLGYSSKDILTDGGFALAQWNAGNALIYTGYAEKVLNHELAGVEGSEQQYVKIGDLPLYKQKDYDWGVSFAKGEEENLDRWFEFFDWIYESKENYLFSIYGVEGKNWNYNDIGTVESKTSDNMLYSWFIGSLLYDEYLDKDPVDVAAYKALESGDVITEVSLGFVFDKTAKEGMDVIDAALKTLIDEKVKPLVYGFGNYDQEWSAIYEELKAAGYEEYCEEYIRQYNEWRASK